MPAARELTPRELPFLYVTLGLCYIEIGAVERALAPLDRGAQTGTGSVAWRSIGELSGLLSAYLRQDRDELTRRIELLRNLPQAAFAPVDAMLVLPVCWVMIDLAAVDDARRFADRRRAAVTQHGSPAYLAGLAVIDARLAAHEGQRAAADGLLARAVQQAQDAEHAPVLRRALELRVALFGRPEDRAALDRLHRQIAASLPDDLRAIFLASPRVRAVAAAPS
ncbi:MAG: hypothetical protein QN183_00915 [Armatimonadota bacterium]|nr:hypothetical protein [Armatimonadota bacterium]MDR7486114.1 hypothetical protein [Armatimonadota bacterium]MDR7534910.1 hypothetical protein [Armatimonadota bacterium]